MALLRNLRDAARPLADERPQEPLIHRRQLRSDEHCVMTMESSSCHPVQSAQPLQLRDAAQLVDFLRQDGISVFRLAFLPTDRARQMLDFLSGAAIVRQGGLYRIASQTYLLTPPGVTVDEALLRHLESEGLYTRDEQTRHLRLA